ncbi:hypothetical protein CCMSSC00406_0009691 [Pleurotus cornucopiae]|uniref:Uncharacterized protein n=1 Tax=Pleurotus cornucopiae TaxID=5321 RepID=A0ACB7J1Z0_PLECO|nr:hypothetical protein CCMSSC00406_0009691 [Pleurotus cornucopiae]
MPKLRELSMPFILSTAALDAFSSKFSALIKLNLILCAPAPETAPIAALRCLRAGICDGMWDGDGSSSGLYRLDDMRGRHAVPDECRLFRSGSLGITRLFLKVDVLDGPLVDMLTASFRSFSSCKYLSVTPCMCPAMTREAQNSIPAVIPGLPLEVLSTIVNEFDAAKSEDRRTLRSLLFVCRELSSLALRPLYQDISFSQEGYEWDEHPFGHELDSLARDAKTNPGLQYTTSFSCILVHSYSDCTVSYDKINGAVGDIIPFLINVRRITISLEGCPIDTSALRSLPLTAPLSHLKLLEWSISSDSLQQFLASRPSLKYLHVNTVGDPSERSSLAVNALPHLLSLSIGASDMFLFEHSLPSLTNLNLCNYDTRALDDAEVISRMAPFASITAGCLEDIAFTDIAPIVSSFPLLEYLWILPQDFGRDINYDALSATKLKYLRCYSPHKTARAFGGRMLDTVKTLVVVDVTSPPMHHTIRMHNSDYRGQAIYPANEWGSWWEHAVRVVELAGRFETQPPPPEGLKYVCLSDPDKLDDSARYPVLILGKYEYWALSHIDNRYGMTVLAYDDQKDIAGRWTKTGARYVHHIEYDEGNQQVKFVGQASHAITFELKVTKSARFG